ncbi:MAG: hypothetical protein ACREJO_17360 [Phycisphaerales bacterium]
MSESPPTGPREPKDSNSPREPHHCANCDKVQPHEVGKVRADGLIPLICTVCGAVSYKLARFSS